MQIGNLKQRTSGELANLTGYVKTLDLHLHLRFEGDPTLCDRQEPSHNIFARGVGGAETLIGRAWLKTAKTGPNPGDKFFSISIDDPSLKAPLNVAAFKDRASGEWMIVWKRRAAQSAPVAVES